MRAIQAREIKRRGISAVDEALKDGPVHVIKNDRPAYVIMDEAQSQELLETQSKAYVARVKAALRDLRAGRIRKVSAQRFFRLSVA